MPAKIRLAGNLSQYPQEAVIAIFGSGIVGSCTPYGSHRGFLYAYYYRLVLMNISPTGAGMKMAEH